jgi:hypothetical protein
MKEEEEEEEEEEERMLAASARAWQSRDSRRDFRCVEMNEPDKTLNGLL